MEMDLTFVYGIVGTIFLVLFALFLAKKFKRDDQSHSIKKKKEKEREIFSLAGDDDLTAEEKARLIDVLAKKY